MTRKHTLYICTLFLLLTACKREDFLDRFPQDAISEPTFFKNENDLKLYLNQFYDALPVQRGNSEANSDNFAQSSRDVFLAGEYVVPATDNNWNYAAWANIRNVNYFLQRYDRAQMDGTVKNYYVAEARFFRAMFYWDKVKRYGAVPWLSRDLTDTSSAILYGPRQPHKQVMDSVLADLNYAVANAAEGSNTQFRGRITKDVANALKARICLWEGTFRKYQAMGDETPYLRAAADAAEAVMNTGRYSIWKTGNPTKDYYNLFIQEELRGNPEAILARRYIKDISMHNLTRQISDIWPALTKDFVRSFLDKNGVPTALSPLYRGDETLDNELIDRDPRFTQIIATRGFVVTANPGGNNDVVSLPRIPGVVTGYAAAKNYSPDPAQWNANQSTLDLFIFRYAETLLIFAEAKAELGEGSQAVIDRTINEIRSRVNMAPMVIAALVRDPQSKFPGIPVLLDEIRRERRIELVGDGFRFDDLLRWKAGTLINNAETILGMKLTPALRAQYPANQVSNVIVDGNFYIRVYNNITSRTWNDKLYLYPLPTNELTLNPALLPQNPNW
ncbi:RagB/SusD family nutrient uptake outer membrane protein [Chitinophaga barathri]|uniref:RagB/SusD family nutrient uptake outer membrane protein n=1 Tax=Chitinophaga barathri TaxID=1647451 RepID=A0A3N4MJR8_9BACT|nr:RagB/SusD family nutrient uptake outer membrane protein [Chitinophaga barathri]RPD39839.1 RagB/SusD family nutrient uptake outer membrane protein [Chitinophaga barathri]